MRFQAPGAGIDFSPGRAVGGCGLRAPAPHTMNGVSVLSGCPSPWLPCSNNYSHSVQIYAKAIPKRSPRHLVVHAVIGGKDVGGLPVTVVLFKQRIESLHAMVNNIDILQISVHTRARAPRAEPGPG